MPNDRYGNELKAGDYVHIDRVLCYSGKRIEKLSKRRHKFVCGLTPIMGQTTGGRIAYLDLRKSENQKPPPKIYDVIFFILKIPIWLFHLMIPTVIVYSIISAIMDL